MEATTCLQHGPGCVAIASRMVFHQGLQNQADGWRGGGNRRKKQRALAHPPPAFFWRAGAIGWGWKGISKQQAFIFAFATGQCFREDGSLASPKPPPGSPSTAAPARGDGWKPSPKAACQQGMRRSSEAEGQTLLRLLRSLMLLQSCWISATWSATRFCSLSFSASVSSSVSAS